VWREASLYFARLFCWRKITRTARNFGLIFYALAVCATNHAAETRPHESGRYKGPDAGLRQAPVYKRATKLVTDEVGRRVAIPITVQKIVTLAPDLTETIYALGLEGRLAGDTSYCDRPPAAKDKPHVGAPKNPSLEAIIALHPDLVLATTSINGPETVGALERLGIAVYTTDPHTVEGMLDSFRHIADLAGASERGEAIVTQLQTRLNALHADLEDRPLVHVLFVVWEDPLITIGQNTFIADALRWAGAESAVVAKENWPRLSMEEVVRLQPEYIVLASNHTGQGAAAIEDLRLRAGWKELRAIQLGHVAIISDEVNIPAPGLIDAIEQLARMVHPEAFAGKKENGKLEIENGFNTDVRSMELQECEACAR
jgi:iron complex transport system substrate-binding protein